MICTPNRYDWSTGIPQAIPSRMAKMSRAARMLLDGLVVGWAILLVAAALALLTTGCGTGDSCPTSHRDDTLRLQPSAELADVVASWAERWSAATGRTILVGTEGASVTVDNQIGSVEVDCGQTQVTFSSATKQWVSTQWIVIDTSGRSNCPAWGYTVGHEMGHALSACGHVNNNNSLMHAGLEPRGRAYVIDEAALALVCSTSDCAVFAPEKAL